MHPRIEQLFYDVYGSVHILAYDTLGEDDGILVVVTFPRDVRHLEVLTERQFAAGGSITLGEHLTFDHLIALTNDRMEVDGGILVGLLELRHLVLFLCGLEGDELLFLRAVVLDTDDVSIDIGDGTVAFGDELGAAIGDELLLDTGTYYRRFGRDQRHGLAHHVRSHEGTVGIIVLQERDEGRCYGSDLAGRYVHEVDLRRRYDREVGTETGLDLGTDEATVLAERCVTLRYNLVLLILSGEVNDMVVIEVHDAVRHLTIRRLDEAEVVDLGVDTHGRDKTDVRSFRRLDRAETAIVGIVYVTHLEAGTVTTQTAGTQGRHTALMGDLGERVLLIHELAQGVGTEVRIDDRRDRLGVDQIGRRKDLVVTDVHTLTDGARHTSQTDTELVVELLTDGTYTTVGQVVDIVHLGVGVDEHDEVLDDLDYVFLSQDTCVLRDGHIELAVDTVTTYLTQVITLLGEEEVLDHLTCRSIIGRLCITELAVDIEDRLFLGLSRVFLQGVEDDGEVVLTLLIFVEQDGFRTGLEDDIDDLRRELFLTLDNDLVTFDGRYLTGVLIDEVLDGRFHDVTREFTPHASLECLTVNLHFLSEVEAVEDVLIGLKTDGAEQGGNRQFLLTVDVSIHDLVDVGCELDPRTAERDDTRRIELGAVRVDGRSEEHTRRTVKLRHDDTLRTVDDKGAFRSHVRDCTEVHIGNDGVKILMIGIVAAQTQFGFQRHGIGQTAFDALLDGVARTIDAVVQESEREAVTGILNGEVLREYLKESLFTTLLRSRIHLEEIGEGLQLNVEKVRVRHMLLHTAEVDSLLFFVCSHYFIWLIII